MKEREEAPYGLDYPAYKAIRNYSKTRFTALAHKAVAQFEQIGAVRAYGLRHRHRTLWDEYCHYIQEESQNNSLGAAFAVTGGPIAQGIVGSIEKSDASRCGCCTKSNAT
jgi:hypothetical protein